MLSPELKSKINKLWDKFWSRGITNPITAIEQISYLLFMRRLDEMDTSKLVKSEFTEEKFESVFIGKFKQNPDNPKEKETKDNTIDKKKLRWSHFKELEPEAMLALVNKFVSPFIKSLQSSEQPYTRSMQNAVFLITSPLLLDEAVKAIDEIYEEIKKQQDAGQEFQDTQGDVYEYLLNELGQAGKNGQFRTPRHII
jgi:type I restriction enzyme M protein